jgi:hypothetical protein
MTPRFMTNPIQSRSNPIPFWNARFVALSISAVIVLSTQSAGQAQTKEPFSANPVTIEGHGRALEDVLTQIQWAFQYPINYEELPLENISELKAVMGRNKERDLVSPASALTVTLGKLDSTPYLAVQSVLSAYAQAGYPGTYKAVQHEHRIDVLPAQVRSSSGSMRDLTPILTIPISFPIAKRTSADTVQLILDSASKRSGYRLLIIGAPTPHFQSVELGANGEALGDVLENLATALSSTFSFTFRYMPGHDTYYFDFTGVVAPTTFSGKPPVQGGKKPLPTHGPENSPFFVKSN